MSVSTQIDGAQSLMSFDSIVSLDAVQGLEKSRSDAFLTSMTRQKAWTEANKIKTVWDIKPIDFSVKIYQPNPLPRNSREAMIKDWSSIKSEGESTGRLVNPSVPRLHLPALLLEKDTDPRPKFEAKHRPPSSQTSRVVFIREGKFQPEPYFTDSVGIHRRDLFRKLEDFRQYHKFGIYDFEASSDRDPQNLRFRSKMLSLTLPELSTTKQIAIRTCESEPIPKFRSPPRWERRLHLPRSAYKKGRSAHTALMERVQSNISWINHNDKIIQLQRPDIYDHKTKDWCDVTGAPDESKGPFPLG